MHWLSPILTDTANGHRRENILRDRRAFRHISYISFLPAENVTAVVNTRGQVAR